VTSSNAKEDSLIYLGDASAIVVAALAARTKFGGGGGGGGGAMRRPQHTRYGHRENGTEERADKRTGLDHGAHPDAVSSA
jgi:hypothetical protein